MRDMRPNTLRLVENDNIVNDADTDAYSIPFTVRVDEYPNWNKFVSAEYLNTG